MQWVVQTVWLRAVQTVDLVQYRQWVVQIMASGAVQDVAAGAVPAVALGQYRQWVQGNTCSGSGAIHVVLPGLYRK